MNRVALFDRLFDATQARIGLGRAGSAVPTRPLLNFQFACGKARDAVHSSLDTGLIIGQLGGRPHIEVKSQATDRATFLKRPDLGRRLAPESREKLQAASYDVAFIIADGLSAEAVHRHAVPLLEHVVARLADCSFSPVVIAHQSRVALGDDIGEQLGASIAVMLIGERPGLTSADSLGVYLTWAPKIGRRDHERNCISNIRPLGGQSYENASYLLAWLIREARRRKLTGVKLKDESSGPGRLEAE